MKGKKEKWHHVFLSPRGLEVQNRSRGAQMLYVLMSKCSLSVLKAEFMGNKFLKNTNF